MKKLIALAFVLCASPAFATPEERPAPTYRPFQYQTQCYLINEKQMTFADDTCTVIETREKGGALRTRNIYSNRFGLTIKSRFDKEKGFVTWDSHNKFEYKWEYKVGAVDGLEPKTYVMPGFMLENVSWD